MDAFHVVKKTIYAIQANRARGETSKDRIFFLIAESEPFGISTGDLVKKTRLHRDRIHTICKEYINKGIIKKSDKLGKYHLGPKADEDIHLRAALLQRKIVERFFASDSSPISISNKFCDLDRHRNDISQQVISKSQDLDEFYFLEYCMKLGAIIAYQMLQSIRFANIELVRFLAFDHFGDSSKGDEETNKINNYIIKWIDNAITPSTLIQTFRQLSVVNKRLSGLKKDDATNAPRLILDFELEELEKIFRKVFPGLFNELEKISQNLSEPYKLSRDGVSAT